MNDNVAWYVWVGEPIKAHINGLRQVNNKGGINYDSMERVEDIVPGDIVTVDRGRPFKTYAYYGGTETHDEFSPARVIRHGDGAIADRKLYTVDPVVGKLVEYTVGHRDLYEMGVSAQKSKYVLASELKKQNEVEIAEHCERMGWNK